MVLNAFILYTNNVSFFSEGPGGRGTGPAGGIRISLSKSLCGRQYNIVCVSRILRFIEILWYSLHVIPIFQCMLLVFHLAGFIHFGSQPKMNYFKYFSVITLFYDTYYDSSFIHAIEKWARTRMRRVRLASRRSWTVK